MYSSPRPRPSVYYTFSGLSFLSPIGWHASGGFWGWQRCVRRRCRMRARRASIPSTASPLLLRRTTMTIRTLESHGQRDYLQPPLSALKPPSIRPTSLPCIGPLRCCAKRQWSGRILITRRVRHAASTAHHRTPCGSQFYLLTPDRIHRNCTQSSAPLRLQLGKSSSRSC